VYLSTESRHTFTRKHSRTYPPRSTDSVADTAAVGSRQYALYLRQAYTADEASTGMGNLPPAVNRSAGDALSVASYSSDGSEMAGVHGVGGVGSRSSAMRELRERIQRERQQLQDLETQLAHRKPVAYTVSPAVRSSNGASPPR